MISHSTRVQTLNDKIQIDYLNTDTDNKCSDARISGSMELPSNNVMKDNSSFETLPSKESKKNEVSNFMKKNGIKSIASAAEISKHTSNLPPKSSNEELDKNSQPSIFELEDGGTKENSPTNEL